MNIGVVLAYDYLLRRTRGWVMCWARCSCSCGADGLYGGSPVAGRSALTCGAQSQAVHMAKESGEKTVCAAEKRERDELLHPQDYRMHLKKRDFAIMGVLTLVYGAVAFYHLGATKAPQTGYVSTAAGETVGA